MMIFEKNYLIELERNRKDDGPQDEKVILGIRRSKSKEDGQIIYLNQNQSSSVGVEFLRNK